MSRVRKDPLRALTAEECSVLNQIARAHNEPASHVARAKMLLAVAEGKTYGQAAQAAGRKSNDAVSQLVSRFNQAGLAALAPRHGGGAQVVYGPKARERILHEARRPPDPAPGGGRLAHGQYLYDLVRAARRQHDLAAKPQLVRDRSGQASPQAGCGDGH